MPNLDIVPRNGRFFVFDRTRLLADFPTSSTLNILGMIAQAADNETDRMLQQRARRNAQGDVPVTCPECHGFGTVEGYTAKPWQVGDLVECETCRGTGEVWREAIKPEELLK